MSKVFNNNKMLLDKKMAKLLGLKEAIILQQVHYWLELNKKNKRNFHKGRYWTYNTIVEWGEEFPFWCTATIKRAFKKLRDLKIVITDNFNSFQMDRTLWYSIDYDVLEKIMGEDDNTDDDSKDVDSDDQNNITKRSEETKDDVKNDPMEDNNLTQAIPETSTENSSEISNQSISHTKRNIEKRDGRTGSYNDFLSKYEKTIKKCELNFIDENYRIGVAHAIKLMYLEGEKNHKIKIGDNYIPRDMVIKDMEKLDYFTIEYAVNKFKEASSKIEIKNTVSYLKTLIYNAIGEMKVEMDSRLRFNGVVF